MPSDDVDPEFWADGQHSAPEAPTLEVEDNPEIGRLYGPDGSLVSIVRARPVLPFGFGR